MLIVIVGWVCMNDCATRRCAANSSSLPHNDQVRVTGVSVAVASVLIADGSTVRLSDVETELEGAPHAVSTRKSANMTNVPRCRRQLVGRSILGVLCIDC